MLNEFFKFLITQNVSTKDFNFYSLLSTIPITILVVSLCQLLDAPLQIIIILPIYVSYTIYLRTNYSSYLKSQLTKQTYRVKKTRHDNYVITSDNKKIKNEVSKTQVVTTPTTDKNKVGKSYYTIEVYKPEKVKKLLDSSTNKYQNRLVQHVYVSEQE